MSGRRTDWLEQASAGCSVIDQVMREAHVAQERAELLAKRLHALVAEFPVMACALHAPGNTSISVSDTSADPRPGWAEELAPEAGVVLAGMVTGPVLAGLYGRARLVAYVPLLEGFGLPAVEAMYACAPVVASPMPSTGGAAFEVDPRDTDAIADALVQVAGQEGVRSQLVTAGVLRSSELTWAAAAGRHVELWNEVLSQ